MVDVSICGALTAGLMLKKIVIKSLKPVLEFLVKLPPETEAPLVILRFVKEV